MYDDTNDNTNIIPWYMIITVTIKIVIITIMHLRKTTLFINYTNIF